MWSAFPGLRPSRGDFIARGDRVACRFHRHAAHTRMGIPAT